MDVSDIFKENHEINAIWILIIVLMKIFLFPYIDFIYILICQMKANIYCNVTYILQIIVIWINSVNFLNVLKVNWCLKR